MRDSGLFWLGMILWVVPCATLGWRWLDAGDKHFRRYRDANGLTPEDMPGRGEATPLMQFWHMLFGPRPPSLFDPDPHAEVEHLRQRVLSRGVFFFAYMFLGVLWPVLFSYL